MKQLWFCLNIWNEEDMLSECLQSIRKFYPDAKIVAVDGAYKSFIQETRGEIAFKLSLGHGQVARSLERFTIPESTDRTMEILKDFHVEKIIDCPHDAEGKPIPWESEIVKRSTYFVGETGDLYFILDGDERVVGEFNRESVNEDANTIMLRPDDCTVAYKVLRIFKHHDGMHYEGAHHALWIGDRLHTRKGIFTRLNDNVGNVGHVNGVMVEHAQTLRSKRDPVRNMAKGAYYRHLTGVEEGAFRNQYSL